jgi:hypothetical protein
VLIRLFPLVLLAAVAFAQPHNKLTDAERREGWLLLFDGRSLDGWQWSTDLNPPLPSWAAEDGLLRTTPEKGTRVYLLTRDSFSNYELKFDWKMEPEANSGVKYRFQGYWVDGKLQASPSGSGRIEPVALEYQIIDDQRHPDAKDNPRHATAAIYEYRAAVKDGPVQPGIWHTTRIVARGLHIEHWLNGKKVLDVELDSPEMQKEFQLSRRRGSSPVLARHERRESPIALQFHDGIVWFRNLKIRRLPAS